MEKNGKYLYCCSSYYQVLISIMDAASGHHPFDLILEEHGMETANELALSLKKELSDLDRVWVCPNDKRYDPYLQRNASFWPGPRKILDQYFREVFSGKTEIARTESGMSHTGPAFSPSSYSKILVYWDLGYAGTWFNIHHIHYTLCEDSLNSYQKIRENRPHYSYLFARNRIPFLLKKVFHYGIIPFGYSPMCDSVEVNDKKGIQIPLTKVREVPRKELEKSLTPAQKKQIFKAFLPNAGAFSGSRDPLPSCLILTEPFAQTDRLPDTGSQLQVYRDLISTYGTGYRVYIKPHPRDDTDYEKVFPDCIVLAKNAPMEVLNYDPGCTFDRAVTISSSAIGNLSGVKESIYLGAEFLKSYR